MKIVKKISTIILVAILLLINLFSIIGTNNVQAATLPIDKADLYSKGEVVYFQYDNIGIGVEVIVYKKDGVEYPAYCINKGKTGVTEEKGYTVNIDSLISNVKIWRAVINGYPFKSIEELGCATMEEAYAATKMAVYDAMYHYDLDKFTLHDRNQEQGKRVVKAIKQIITAARNSKETKPVARVTVDDVTKEWKVDNLDKQSISKTFCVNATAANEEFTVNLTGPDANIAKVVDMNNNERSTFKTDEHFKIIIPISATEAGGDIYINVSSELKTKPVLLGEAPDPTLQNLAVVAGEFEEADTSERETFYRNHTKLEIYKQDGDELIPLADSIFTLLDENKNVVYTDLKTDENGKVEIENLIPGKYYLKEIEAPEGYYGYDEELEIEVKYNEALKVTVNNYKIPEEEDYEKPQDENRITVGEKREEKKLPRTGY